MLALSIRQPWAELILRGVKTVEYRSRRTSIVGRRFWIYAAGKWPPGASALRELEAATRVWSRDLAMPWADADQRSEIGDQAQGSEGPPAWMLDLLGQIMKRELQTGVIVGSAVIEKVTPPTRADGLYRWHLSEVKRARRVRKPLNHPQPVWFEPFGKAA